MLKYTIPCKDFFGNEREETCYFNLTETEVTKMMLSKNGGLDKYYQRIVESKNTEQLGAAFEDLVDKTYGVPSLDGREFVKTDELLSSFKSTQMYNILHMKLVSDAKFAAMFWNGVIPTENAGVGDFRLVDLNELVETEKKKDMPAKPDAGN